MVILSLKRSHFAPPHPQTAIALPHSKQRSHSHTPNSDRTPTSQNSDRTPNPKSDRTPHIPNKRSHFNVQHLRKYLSQKNNDEGDFIKISVNPANSKKNLVVFKYQIPISKKIQNQFIDADSFTNQISDHNSFTGLVYVYNPNSGSELQYWCVANYNL